MLHRLARTPLLMKLIVLDSVVNLFAFLVMQWAPPDIAERVLLLSLFGVLVLNAALVAWALSPLQVLEKTTRRVSSGELTARALMPRLADRNLIRIGDTLNTLLDRLAAERARVRHLAGLVVAAEDAERARIARELHDGTAQSLSALEMLLASTIADQGARPVVERLTVMQTVVTDALLEVRALAQGMHPRVLDDLGLAAALDQLARQAEVTTDIEVTVEADAGLSVPALPSSVLYRVAQEALHNAVKHSGATRVAVRLSIQGAMAEVCVRDNGSGFDPGEVARRRSGMGLFVMEERVSLVDGTLSLRRLPEGGTEIVGRVPLREVP